MLNGAEDETRTRDIHLGKVALYQLSHFRILSICTARRAAPVVVGAEDETRTRDIHLGKVALYQLSHFRMYRYMIIKVVIHPRFELGTP